MLLLFFLFLLNNFIAQFHIEYRSFIESIDIKRFGGGDLKEESVKEQK